jgi:hypothetical protein
LIDSRGSGEIRRFLTSKLSPAGKLAVDTRLHWLRMSSSQQLFEV